MPKRFIAGAVCPSCNQIDTLALTICTTSGTQQVACVRCGHALGEIEKTPHTKLRVEEEVIGYFRP